MLAFLPRDERFLTWLWRILLTSMGLWLAVFLYRYVVVFDATFLGNEWGQLSRQGKNQLGILLAALGGLGQI